VSVIEIAVFRRHSARYTTQNEGAGVGHLKRFIVGITSSILSSCANFHMSNGGNIRAFARSGGFLFPGSLRLKTRSEYGAVLKTSDINKVVEQIRLPVPY